MRDEDMSLECVLPHIETYCVHCGDDLATEREAFDHHNLCPECWLRRRQEVKFADLCRRVIQSCHEDVLVSCIAFLEHTLDWAEGARGKTGLF